MYKNQTGRHVRTDNFSIYQNNICGPGKHLAQIPYFLASNKIGLQVQDLSREKFHKWQKGLHNELESFSHLINRQS